MSEKASSPSYYPVFLDIAGKRCAVIGGGQVALRKVQTLLEYKAKVEVISPELCPELAAIEEISVRNRQYQPGDLKGAFLAIVATDNHEINHRIAREARSQGILVNVVDDAEYCDFILPSLVRRGDMTIAVSTAGRSPALARKLRTRLEQDFGEEYAALIVLVDEVRRELKQQGITVDSEIWQDALELDLLIGLVKLGQTEKARALLMEGLSRKKHREVRRV